MDIAGLTWHRVIQSNISVHVGNDNNSCDGLLLCWLFLFFFFSNSYFGGPAGLLMDGFFGELCGRYLPWVFDCTLEWLLCWSFWRCIFMRIGILRLLLAMLFQFNDNPRAVRAYWAFSTSRMARTQSGVPASRLCSICQATLAVQL